MTRLEALKDLKANVEAGEWAGRPAAVLWPFGRIMDNNWLHEYGLAFKAYEGSLDAALALHEAVLPGWKWCRFANSDSIGVISPAPGHECWSYADPIPARAWLLAILTALISQENRNVDDNG
jgi:hypothetical protein